MTKWVGILGGDQTVPRIKRHLLMFDQVAVVTHEGFPPMAGNHVEAQRHFDWLVEQGLASEERITADRIWRDDPDFIALLDAEMGRFDHLRQKLPKVHDVAVERLTNEQLRESANILKDIVAVHQSMLTRLFALHIASNEIEAVSCIDLPRSVTQATEVPGLSPVIHVVLEALPIPDESISFERLLDFKTDTEASHSLGALRLWMRDMARGQIPAAELAERLEWLVNEHERHLTRHKLKSNRTAVESVITTTLEAAEDLVRFKWGHLAKTIFSVRSGRIALLEAEANSPGRNVSFIASARREFA